MKGGRELLQTEVTYKAEIITNCRTSEQNYTEYQSVNIVKVKKAINQY
jgi:hypothetical protein